MFLLLEKWLLKLTYRTSVCIQLFDSLPSGITSFQEMVLGIRYPVSGMGIAHRPEYLVPNTLYLY